MKSAPFAYRRAQNLAEASALLREYGDDARLLAGGQTLLATLAMRLSEPALLIDINEVAELKGVAIEEGKLRVGALVRHVEIERSELIARHLPLLSLAAPHVAHAAIRNRGTFGGSIAFADPAAEWPACAVAADGVLVLSDGDATRRVKASDFFIDLYQTDLRRGELIAAVEFPLPGPSRRFAFAELSRRHGDYAIVGLALAGDVVNGKLADMRIVYFGAGNIPVRAFAAEAALEGTQGDAAALAEAVKRLPENLAPTGDLTTSGETKLHLAGVLLRRTLPSLFNNERGR
jgi:carbon-monoxide dehydrogenase medium subunit